MVKKVFPAMLVEQVRKVPKATLAAQASTVLKAPHPAWLTWTLLASGCKEIVAATVSMASVVFQANAVLPVNAVTQVDKVTVECAVAMALKVNVAVKVTAVPMVTKVTPVKLDTEVILVWMGKMVLWALEVILKLLAFLLPSTDRTISVFFAQLEPPSFGTVIRFCTLSVTTIITDRISVKSALASSVSTPCHLPYVTATRPAATLPGTVNLIG